MFEKAIAALQKEKKEILEKSRREIASRDQEIARLEQLEKQGGQQPANTSSKSTAAKPVTTKPNEFAIFQGKLWPAIKLVLERHRAFRDMPGLDCDVLVADLRIGGALKKYKPEYANRLPMQTIGQHKDEARWDEESRKCWLLRSEDEEDENDEAE